MSRIFEQVAWCLVGRATELPRFVIPLGVAALFLAGLGPDHALLAAEPQSEVSAKALMPRIEVAIDEKFSLGQAETALVRGLDILVTVTRLSYTRCPAGAMCVVPDGPNVTYEVHDATTRGFIRRGNNHNPAPSHFPWFVRYVGSDGRTYARFAAHDTVQWCQRVAPESRMMWCWRQTAELSRDASHCTRIADVPERANCVFSVARVTGEPAWCKSAPNIDMCHEMLARELKRPELCGSVTNPRSYCITAAVAAGGEINRCKRISSARGDCYEAAARQAKSLSVCAQLPDPYKRECRGILKGWRISLPDASLPDAIPER
ncbi:MAG: hypothetical protein U1E90_07730 [Burkholderiaceae bacterium]